MGILHKQDASTRPMVDWSNGTAQNRDTHRVELLSEIKELPNSYNIKYIQLSDTQNAEINIKHPIIKQRSFLVTNISQYTSNRNTSDW